MWHRGMNNWTWEESTLLLEIVDVKLPLGYEEWRDISTKCNNFHRQLSTFTDTLDRDAFCCKV